MPFGVHRNIGVLQVFDEALLRRAINSPGRRCRGHILPVHAAGLESRDGTGVCSYTEYVEIYFRYSMTPEEEQ